MLAGFLGSRWWRSGITAFLDQLGDDAAAGGLVAREFGLEVVVIDEPVVSLDDEYRTVADLIDVSETVTLQLDAGHLMLNIHMRESIPHAPTNDCAISSIRAIGGCSRDSRVCSLIAAIVGSTLSEDAYYTATRSLMPSFSA